MSAAPPDAAVGPLVPLRGEGDVRIAIVVAPDLPPGLLANTVGAVGIGIGAAMPGLGRVTLEDAAGASILASADRPVPILSAGERAMRALLVRSADRPADATVVAFPAFARALHAFTDYAARVPECALSEVKIDGIGLVGPTKWVRSLTGSLKLLR